MEIIAILIPMLLIFLRTEHRLTKIETILNGGKKKKGKRK